MNQRPTHRVARWGILLAGFLAATLSIRVGGLFAQEDATEVTRGRYLVDHVAACGQCHTPRKGAEADTSNYLAGHPASAPAPQFSMELIQQGVFISISRNYTGFAGPWGVAFATNLTPDAETGLGNRTVDQFILALRTGKHLGGADRRPILPPMPWKHYQGLSDADLRAIWAYLQTIDPISNAVPPAKNRFGNPYE